MVLTISILVRILANPFSSVFQKVLTRREAEPIAVICVPLGILSLACGPLLFIRARGIAPEFWPNIVICAALAVAGNVLIVKAVARADLSVLGPINAYKAVVSLVPGAILLHEIPGPLGLWGMGLIVAGSYVIAGRGAGTGGTRSLLRLFANPGVQLRLAALVLSAVEAVFLKRAVLASSPFITFLFWCVFGFGLSLGTLAVLLRRSGMEAQWAETRGSWREYLLLALTTGAMQLATLLTFHALQVGYALALFQASTLVTVLLGYRIFREPHFLRRLSGAAVMTAGAAFIIVSSR